MDTIGTNIIFSMGLSGAGKFKADALLAAGAIAAVGAAVLKVQGQAEEFRMTFERMTDSQLRGVMAMDRASGGFIDTMGLMQAQVKATEAGIGGNTKLMEAMGKIVADVSRKLGEGPDAMLARMNKLTDAISKGQSRALKEYGIDLEISEDLLLAQGEAIEKVIERAKGLETQLNAENMREGFSRLQNDVGTTLGLLWGSVADSGGGLAGAFDVVHDAMGSFNDLLMSPDTKDPMNDYIWSLEGVTDAINSAIKMWGLGEAALTQFGDTFVSQVARIKLLAAAREMGRQLGQARIAATGKQLAEGGGLKATTRSLLPEGGGGGSMPRGGGGGGRRPDEDMVFSEEDVAAYDTSDLLGGDIAESQRRWQEKTMAWELAQDERDEIERQKKMEQNAALAEIMLQQYQWEQERHAEHWEAMLGVEEQAVQASAAMWASGLQTKAEMMSGFFHNVSMLQQVENKKMWQIGKAAAISEAIINTYLAAVKAYQAMSGIPIVGPVLGGIASAAITAAGLALVAKIVATKYGDTAAVTGVAGASPPPGGTDAPGPGMGGGVGGWGGGGVTNITVQIGEEPILSAALNANDAASQNGQKHFKVSA